MHNFECDVIRKFNVEHLEKEMENLRIIKKESEKEIVENTLLLSVNPEESLFNNFTLKHEEKPLLLSIYNREDINDEGFRMKDLKCWEEFLVMMEHDKQVKLKLTLSF